MGLTTQNTGAISFKKVSGKAHTQQNFTVSEESIATNLQVASSTIFANKIESLPVTNSGLTTLYSTNGIIQRIKFPIDIIPNTQIGVNQSQGYRLKLPADWNTHPGALYPAFSAGTYLHTALGRLQIVPSLYGKLKPDGSTEFDPILYQTNGSTVIAKFDPINWYFDPYDGVLFVEDPSAGYDINAARPGFLEAFLYVGDYVNDLLNVMASGSTGTTGINVGGGVGVFKDKLGDDLRFKTLVGGSHIAITGTTNNVVISFTGSSGAGTITGATNGLSLTGGGKQTRLGGTFTGDTTLNGNKSHQFNIVDMSGITVSNSNTGFTRQEYIGAKTADWITTSYGAGLYVSIANNSTDVQTSPDGINWTARTGATADGWFSSVYGGGLFVAVAINSIGIQTSSDGITWTQQTGATSDSWTSVAYGAGLYVAVSQSTNNIQTSPDGITWTLRTGATSAGWRSITYAAGLFVAVAQGSSDIQTSPDGITWTLRTGVSATGSVSVTYGNGLFVAVSNNTTDVQTSPDGITWTLRTGQSDTWITVAYGDGLFVAVGNSTDNVETSFDGITWTLNTGATSSNWFSLAFGNGKFVALQISANNVLVGELGFLFKGIKYLNDYSGNFNDRSIPDVGFVKKIISQTNHVIITATNLTLTENNSVSSVFVDTSSGAWTIQLQSTPTDGMEVRIKDYNGFALSNNLTINGNGHNIDGSTSAMIDTNRGGITTVFSSMLNAWYITSFIS